MNVLNDEIRDLSETRVRRNFTRCKTEKKNDRMKKIKKPNVYKGIIGMMDVTYREASERISTTGVFVGDISELCRAVRGYKGAKYDRLRRGLVRVFSEWLVELENSGDAEKLKQYVNVGEFTCRAHDAADKKRMKDASDAARRLSSETLSRVTAASSSASALKKIDKESFYNGGLLS